MAWIIIAIILTAAVILLLFARLYITCDYTYTGGEQKLFIAVSLLGIHLMKKEIDMQEEEEGWQLDFSELPNKLKQGLQTVREMKKMADFILRIVYIHRLEWKTEGGTGDAASTGTVTGAVWAGKGMILGIIRGNLECTPVIRVEPDFQRRYVASSLNCMVSVRLGKAIHAFLKMIRSQRKLQQPVSGAPGHG
ncbi:DUF2953 domain-containing protein [Lentibacillus sediminis]|uniref:DUF2953 domain-containing protein n=1 Tax=Lentibacillus sediminis TaxID=1940529 RepID=UPI000C1C2AF0|nr:DUF2953 domain-containing protein [Lentibacillus sediminis]